MNRQTTTLLYILSLLAIFVTNGIGQEIIIPSNGVTVSQEPLPYAGPPIEKYTGPTDNDGRAENRKVAAEVPTAAPPTPETAPEIVETTTSESITISSLGAIITAVLINFF